jgi:AcrR family transcriptional regulator
MNAIDKQETKEKILEQARLLFSQHGFKGTSIRLIAERSDVNIAAVNYHFGSKENLYWSVIDEGYQWIQTGVKEMAEKAQDVEDLTQLIFRYLRDGGHYMLSMMRTYLSDTVSQPDEDHAYMNTLKSSEMGPPGGEYIAAFLKKRYPDAPEPAIQWVVMCLFSSLFHFSTMTCSHQYETLKKEKFTVESIEHNLQIMARALVEHMKTKTDW